MGLPLRKTLGRLSQISPHELGTRLSQEFHKRAEYAMLRAGLPMAEPRLLPSPGEAPNFFFSQTEVPNRVALLKEHLPSAVENCIREADEILQHRFSLLGYPDLDYGKEVDWHLDAVHGKRAPLKPWYKIRFLDFDEVGDHKVTWELNRHQHLVTLAKAWAFTADEKYTREIIAQFYSWQKANPYALGVNWGSSLEVAFRSLSWLWVRSILGHSRQASFDRDMLLALARNGRYIERYLSTYFSPNTHLIGEAAALFFIGTLCPEIPDAARWQKNGLDVVLNEAQRQVRPDGVYFEQSLYYHVYALDFFLHVRTLAVCTCIAVPEAFDSVLLKMLAVVRALSIGGPPEGFGDDDGGRLFNPRRDRAEHMVDPLAVGAAIFGSSSAGAVTEEAIWLFGDQALNTESQPEQVARPQAAAFPDGGLYVMPDQNGRLVIDAGPQGHGKAGHGHADALSVSLLLDGQPVLVDSGSFVYIPEPQQAGLREKFRGTAAHNTMRVDRLDQAIPAGPFSWAALPGVSTEKWIAGQGFTVFVGSHDGYARLGDAFIHRRTVFHLHDDYWFVRDAAEGRGTHDLEIFWHFAPELIVELSDTGATDQQGRARNLLSAGSDAWQLTVEEGAVSPAYGIAERAPVARCSARTQLPAELGTILLPTTRKTERQQIRFVSAEPAIYCYETEDMRDILVFAGSQWELGAFRSDATFSFHRYENSELRLLIVCGATFLDWNDQQLFHSERPVEWLTWKKSGAVSSSSPELLKFFNEEALRTRTAVR